MSNIYTSGLKKIFNSFLGSRNERILKNYIKICEKINSLEQSISSLSDSELYSKTAQLRAKYVDGTVLEELLPEAFAVVRETSKRVLGMRHFDAQIIGGIALHYGKIAEMKTGEGKTLVATLPSYLNAIAEKKVHVITVNDYLANRDANWMSKIYDALGVSVGIVTNDLEPAGRKEAYDKNIVYGTNNEFGFDYLRDNMAFTDEQKVQKSLDFAIIDEVDSILIDEARTPLIISGPAEDKSELYLLINSLMSKLKTGEEEDSVDFTIDEKSKQIYLTERGHETLEYLLTNKGLLDSSDSLYSPSNVSLMQYINASIRANALFHKNTDYVVKNGQVIIVDEFTGRTMPGRRWSEGLHQAIEAKEKVKIQPENQTLASITFQNFFRQYGKLSGMTGTADTEAYEFQEIYSLEVVVIPTNKDMVRNDFGDVIFLSAEEKYAAIINDIKDCQARGQPVLVGTTSIEISELLSNRLKKSKIKHNVLNAKFHEKEAEIIANAGRPGAITVATNMAGRGTDIVLGGSLATEYDLKGLEKWKTLNESVKDSGGLHIIGTERHESRRIDNQLRGRAGRQGDPGSSRFYLSLEDSLIRIFASDKVTKWMQMAGMKKGESIEHPWITKSIENAQRKVEGRNFDIRKQLLEFDNVANDQRTHIYDQRRELMEAQDISDNLVEIRHNVVEDLVSEYIPQNELREQWDIKGLDNYIEQNYGLNSELEKFIQEKDFVTEAEIKEQIIGTINQDHIDKINLVGEEAIQNLEKTLMLRILDTHWKEHLGNMDYLRQGIHLRGYAQKNPTQEYKREAFMLFAEMLSSITKETIEVLSKIKVDQNFANEVNHLDNIEKPKTSSKALSKNKRKEQRRRRR